MYGQSESKLNEERFDLESSHMQKLISSETRGDKSAFLLEVSNFTTPIIDFSNGAPSVAESTNKNVDGASSTVTPVSTIQYCDSMEIPGNNQLGPFDLSGKKPSAVSLTFNNPDMPIRYSGENPTEILTKKQYSEECISHSNDSKHISFPVVDQNQQVRDKLGKTELNLNKNNLYTSIYLNDLYRQCSSISNDCEQTSMLKEKDSESSQGRNLNTVSNYPMDKLCETIVYKPIPLRMSVQTERAAPRHSSSALWHPSSSPRLPSSSPRLSSSSPRPSSSSPMLSSSSPRFPSVAASDSSTFPISSKKSKKSTKKQSSKMLKCNSCGFVTKSDTYLIQHHYETGHPINYLMPSSGNTNSPVSCIQTPTNTTIFNHTLGQGSNTSVILGGNTMMSGNLCNSPIPQMKEMTAEGINLNVSGASLSKYSLETDTKTPSISSAPPQLPLSGSENYLDDTAANNPTDSVRSQLTGHQTNLVHSKLLENTAKNAIKVFGCYVCKNFCTDSLQDLTRHVNTDRSKPDDSMMTLDGALYSCKLCRFRSHEPIMVEIHCEGEEHLKRLNHSNHIKEGDSNSYSTHLMFPETSSTVCLVCNICSFYSDSLHSFQIHSVDSKHSYNVQLYRFLDSFENEKVNYVCKSCNLGAVSSKELFLHAISKEHKATERRLLDAYGTIETGGIYIIRESRRLDNELTESTTSSTNRISEQSPKEMNKPATSSTCQNDTREDNSTRNKDAPEHINCMDFVPGQINMPKRTIFCPLCSTEFPNQFDFLVHYKEFHDKGENSRKSLKKETISEQLSLPWKQIRETLIDTKIAPQSNQNSQTVITDNTYSSKTNKDLSEHISSIKNSKMAVDSSETAKNYFDRTMTLADCLKEPNSYLKTETHKLESVNKNTNSQNLIPNNDTSCVPLSASDVYFKRDFDSQSSELEVD
ncbi:zinc finger homeobox protein 4 [Nephila pilipes]|uniref:Zinc finger homeobox protein 4 n=1 Tax=Nephila pilipes TaxID=299642 RepID=A0A8X6TVR9_NEPPI|nr:zinc finger homeobox protein 4 [Nephila pilipes]